MTCLTCRNWKPKESGAMARQGFAICAIGPSYTFNSPHHTCEKHTPAGEATTAARRKWIEPVKKGK
jgi:hypothetical protein